MKKNKFKLGKSQKKIAVASQQWQGMQASSILALASRGEAVELAYPEQGREGKAGRRGGEILINQVTSTIC